MDPCRAFFQSVPFLDRFAGLISSRPPRAYLDTCIISGIVKEDLTPEQRVAVEELLRLHKQRVIQLVTSDMSKVEIETVPTLVLHDVGEHRVALLLG